MVRGRLIGVPMLLASSRRVPQVVRERSVSSVAQTVRAMTQRARALVPVQTGALRDAIEGETRELRGGLGIRAGDARGRRPEAYWFMVEYGTVTTAAQPFMRPAAEGEQRPFEQRMASMGPEIERAWGR